MITDTGLTPEEQRQLNAIQDEYQQRYDNIIREYKKDLATIQSLWGTQFKLLNEWKRETLDKFNKQRRGRGKR